MTLFMLDLSNKRFGKLLVLELVGHAKDRNALWKCQCDCGNIATVRSGNLVQGTTRSCGCLRKEKRYNQLPYGEAAFNDLYSRYQRKAKERNLCFELTKDQFRELTNKSCHYCGIGPSKIHKVNKRVGEYPYNGVDRIDNKKGYIIDNVTPCCYLCNKAKSSLSYDEFFTWIHRILDYHDPVRSELKERNG